MSNLTTVPEVVQGAAQDLAGIRASLTDAAATAGPTTGIVAAAEDEISIAIASLFGSAGEQFQALSAQAQAFHAEFESLLSAGAATYVSAEAANAAQVLSGAVGGQAAAAVPAQTFTFFDGILNVEIGTGGIGVTISTPGLTLPAVNVPPIQLSAFSSPQILTPPITVPPLQLPEIQVPGLTLPEIIVPQITFPGIQLPDIFVPGNNQTIVTVNVGLPTGTVPVTVQLNTFDIAPSIGLHTSGYIQGFTIPGISLGAFTIPSIGLSSFTIPSIGVSGFTLPSLTVPPVSVGGFDLPNVFIPNVVIEPLPLIHFTIPV